ncbi:MAG: Lrp/AsnC family transcriptional regulator [bacterium]|nr:Lrp/AsnC family transcriptional regulator [bacterium]
MSADSPATPREELIRAVQAGVPLTPAPFEKLGGDLGLEEARVIEELGGLEREGVLREISAVLEGSALGYESALVAAEVAEPELDRVVEVINAHPTVTHNYLRSHRFNLWFTVAVPPSMGLEATLAALSRASGVPRFHPLQRTQTFKIGVNFDPKTRKNTTSAVAGPEVAKIEISEEDRRCFRALQTPLPILARPFDLLAEKVGVEADDLLAFGHRHLGGAIRRYVGTLRHRKLGVRANGMAVWQVPEAEIERVGLQLAAAPEVSHCYARDVVEGFPYSVYSMIHGPDEATCRKLAEELSQRIGVEDYAVLFSTREFKKTRLRYFLPELDEWWSTHGG